MKAMTAYAHVSKVRKGCRVDVVIKSLNSKYLDILIHHIPPRKINWERKIRKLIEERFSRGRFEVHVLFSPKVVAPPTINRDILQSYLKQWEKITTFLHLKKEIPAWRFLSLPQVISFEEEKIYNEKIVMEAFKESLEKIKEYRKAEGRKIQIKLLKFVNSLIDIIKKMRGIKPKIKEKDISQEDIEEELTLLSFYTQSLKKTVVSKKEIPCGKKIDFLAQEILRELNTCASKTKDQRLAKLIIEGKNYAERIREQAQNVE